MQTVAPSRPDQSRLAVGALLIAGLLWGLTWMPFRYFGAQGLNGITFTMMSYGLIGLLVLPWLLLRRASLAVAERARCVHRAHRRRRQRLLRLGTDGGRSGARDAALLSGAGVGCAGGAHRLRRTDHALARDCGRRSDRRCISPAGWPGDIRYATRTRGPAGAGFGNAVRLAEHLHAGGRPHALVCEDPRRIHRLRRAFRRAGAGDKAGATADFQARSCSSSLHSPASG